MKKSKTSKTGAVGRMVVFARMPSDLARRARCEALRRGITLNALVVEALQLKVPRGIRVVVTDNRSTADSSLSAS